MKEMIRCEVCDRFIAPTARKCPHCGANRIGKILVQRRSSTLLGYVVRVKFTLDGEYSFALRGEQERNITAQSGVHTIKAVYPNFPSVLSREMAVCVTPGKTLKVEVHADADGIDLKEVA